ncbi:hypothetical protein KAR91_40000 [Candidatus Pacearchaeota archaeon]|nr:hypothetical protein [Candidatus Pacearchaeota archaeon]
MKSEKVLNKAELLDEMKLKSEKIQLTKGVVYASEIPATDYMDLMDLSAIENDEEAAKAGRVDMKKFNPALVAYSIVDAKGKRIFSMGDVDVISKASTSVFNKLSESAKRMNGLLGDEEND